MLALPPIEIKKIAEEQEQYTIKLRHKLHQVPEIGWEEEETLKLIREELNLSMKACPYKIELFEKKGGIWVDIDIDPLFKRILFRADIDGLPIQEETNLPFSSQNKDRMHACGHDCHTAMLLGAFKAISQGKCKPLHNLRLVWQRAEEITTIKSGGQTLVEEGVCDGILTVNALHISPSHEKGCLVSRPGPMLCNPGHLKINIECSGGHVAHPNVGSNAIDIITDIHMALRGFELRDLGPNEIISFVPSVSKAGVASNIRPGKGEIWYAIRNFLASKQLEYFLMAIKKRVESIVSSYPNAMLFSFDFFPGFPILQNDLTNYTYVKTLMHKMGYITQKCEFLFAGEDFAYYLRDTPGSFWSLGAKKPPAWDLHTSRFNPDESVLSQGIAFWLALATAKQQVVPDKEED